MKQTNQIVRVDRVDDVAVLSMALPPVNSFGSDMRRALFEVLRQVAADPDIRAVVLKGDGQMFCGGADIREFDQGTIAEPGPNEIYACIEAFPKPVIAAVHGFALGAGLELAMSCHARVGAESAWFGLPETTLGIIPGGGGTQRMPRLIGVEAAVEAMLTAKNFTGAQALTAGLIDAVSKADLTQDAVRWAKRCIAKEVRSQVTSALPVQPLPGQTFGVYFATARAEAARKYYGQPAAAKVIDCVEKAASADTFEEGLRYESDAFLALMRSAESKAMRHLFFSEREAARVSEGVKDRAAAISSVGVIGAGTMGTGIALTLLAAGLQVSLIDVNAASLERGYARIRETLDTLVQKGRIADVTRTAQLERLFLSTELASAAPADLVIEAVFEDFELKRRVVAELGTLCKRDAIIATNTSTLDVDALAQDSGRSQRFLGLHFFSPANIMKLLEIVRGRETAPEVIASALKLAKRIGKTPVVAGVCYGFIGNRMLEGYLRETDRLLMEGCSPQQVDGALERFGMAMGPCRMMDLAGVDVNALVLQQRMLTGWRPRDSSYRRVCRALHAMGHNGQKTGIGYYRYEGRNALPDSEVIDLAASLARQHGIWCRSDISDAEIVERCLYPLIDEGFRILAEGIAQRAGDIDVVWAAGYGFPRFRGGPMHYAQEVGSARIAERMRAYVDQFPLWRADWEPSPALLASA